MPIWRFRIIAKAAFIPANFVQNFRRNCRHSIRTTNTKKKNRSDALNGNAFSLYVSRMLLSTTQSQNPMSILMGQQHTIFAHMLFFFLYRRSLYVSADGVAMPHFTFTCDCVCVCVMCVRLYGSRRHLLDENVLIKHKCTSLSTRFSGAIFGI